MARAPCGGAALRARAHKVATQEYLLGRFLRATGAVRRLAYGEAGLTPTVLSVALDLSERMLCGVTACVQPNCEPTSDSIIVVLRVLQCLLLQFGNGQLNLEGRDVF